MARRKRSSPRRRRFWGKIKRRVPKKIPLEVVIAGVAIPFTPPKSDWASPMEYVQTGDWKDLGSALAIGFLGFNPSDPNSKLDIVGLINPFDLEKGRYLKMLVAAGLVSKIRKRLVKIPFEKVPILGRYIS